jgi:type I restriction enzyme M protein
MANDNVNFRKAISDAIKAMSGAESVVRRINLNADGSGTIEYNPTGVFIAAGTPGFRGTITDIHDEEMVRAYLLAKLVTEYEYRPSPQVIEIERKYDPVGRPIGKGGRVDVFVRRPPKAGKPSDGFLFIECKRPEDYDKQYREMIDGQLFKLSRQEEPRPKYLVYYTVEVKGDELRERLVLIDTTTFSTFEMWDKAGQPITDTIPRCYGRPSKRRYANVDAETMNYRSLDTTATKETFSALQRVLHDVIWGGGGTQSNEVFVYITKLMLCKIFDEKEARPGTEYRFQRLGDEIEPEDASVLVGRMNDLYSEAEDTYLALPLATRGPAFDPGRIPPEKIAYVVGRLEGISVTVNNHSGDILGEFFEQIVAGDFTQTKGQFFTPIILVRLMLEMADVVGQAEAAIRHGRDEQGRPVLPYVIDSSCGSGTFLIEYMKRVTGALGTAEILQSLAPNRRDFHRAWFSQHAKNHWARDFLFGIENNYDLGLAAKVNMVLHGDGSMNTWIKSALLPFRAYWVERRSNVLGASVTTRDHPYRGPRNEQFNLIVSNPPFSIKMSEDERDAISRTFVETGSAASENLFVERWYQLLKEGGRFCCVLPEAILDTSSNEKIRRFLIQHFRVRAVVSLPYDAFRPFTSTKTCIVLAEKRSASEVAAWAATLARVGKALRGRPATEVFTSVVSELGWAEDPIFMRNGTLLDLT